MTSHRVFFSSTWLITYVVWTLCFLVVGNLASGFPARDFAIALDKQIPLVPAFVWIYMLAYVMPVVPLIVTDNWSRFALGTIAFLIANITAFACYFLLPVSLPHPILGTTLSERVLAVIYAHDFSPSANKLPSMHVIASWLMCFMCWRQGLGKSLEIAIAVMAVLISISTLFVKQHLIIDVVAAILWACSSWYIAKWLYSRSLGADGDVQVAFVRSLGAMLPILALGLMFAIPVCIIVFK